MTIEALNIPEVGVNEDFNGAYSVVKRLDAGELLTGTPTVVELGSSDLTIGDKLVNTAELTIEKRVVAVGKAIQFSCTGHVAGRTYRLRCLCGTDSTPAQVRGGIVKFLAVDDTL